MKDKLIVVGYLVYRKIQTPLFHGIMFTAAYIRRLSGYQRNESARRKATEML